MCSRARTRWPRSRAAPPCRAGAEADLAGLAVDARKGERRAPRCPRPSGRMASAWRNTQPTFTNSAAPSTAAKVVIATRERRRGQRRRPTRRPRAVASGRRRASAHRQRQHQQRPGQGSRAGHLVRCARQRAQEGLVVQGPVQRAHREERHVASSAQLEIAAGITASPPGQQHHQERRRQHHRDRLAHLEADHRQRLAHDRAEGQVRDAQQGAHQVLEPEADDAGQHQPAGVAHAGGPARRSRGSARRGSASTMPSRAGKRWFSGRSRLRGRSEGRAGTGAGSVPAVGRRHGGVYRDFWRFWHQASRAGGESAGHVLGTGQVLQVLGAAGKAGTSGTGPPGTWGSAPG